MPSKYKVKWLDLALGDMQNIVAYISQTDSVATQGVVSAIWEASQTLTEFPSRARVGRVPDTRELVLAKLPYFIVFRIKNKTVEILRVVHTSKKYGS